LACSPAASDATATAARIGSAKGMGFHRLSRVGNPIRGVIANRILPRYFGSHENRLPSGRPDGRDRSDAGPHTDLSTPAATQRVPQFENDDVRVRKTVVMPNAPLTNPGQ